MSILAILAQFVLPQLIQALEPAIAGLLSAKTGGDAAAISQAIDSVATASQDAISLNTLISTCKAAGRTPTQEELAPYASHLAVAIGKLQADIDAAA